MLGRVPVDDSGWIRRVVIELVNAGLGRAAEILARRATAETWLKEPKAVGWLLRELKATGQEDALAVLARWAAAEVALDDPAAVGTLLEALQATHCDEALEVLLDRDPARCPMTDSAELGRWLHGFTRLALVLRSLGDRADAAAEVAERRAADAGAFDGVGWGMRYGFGREPDGSASPKWEWRKPDEPSAT
jgi:hypothetical protein